MDIQQYIASGILEQYVLGNLTIAERQEVQQYAMQYPEIKAEIEAIEEALLQYGQAHAIEPLAGLENKILGKLKDRLPVGQSAEETVGGGSGVFIKSIAALGILAALVLGIWGYKQLKKTNVIQQQLAQLQSDYNQLETDCNKQLQQKQQTEQYFAFLRDTNTKPILLAGTPKSPDASASIFWNNDQQKTYLETTSLPAVPSGKQYQLWAIVDGTPVDMGVFDLAVGIHNFLEVPYIADAQAFAITLEDVGGKSVPTLEEMIVIGNNT